MKRIVAMCLNTKVLAVFGLMTLCFVASDNLGTCVLILLWTYAGFLAGHMSAFDNGKIVGEARTNLKWMCAVRPIVNKSCKRVNTDGTVSIGEAYCYMCCRSGIPGEDNFHTDDCEYKRLTRV